MRPSPSRLATAACLAVCAVFFILPDAARATSVIPPDFDGLIAQADTVFTGDVLGVRSEWAGEGANRRIVSFVTFDVLRVMKGQAATPYTLRMLGGTVGTRTMEVSDAPRFATGDRVILFVQGNGTQFFPTVGFMHGVYRLERLGAAAREAGASDAAGPVETVTDHTGRPLAGVEEIGQDATAREKLRRAAAVPAAPVNGAAASAGTMAAPSAAGLTREQFEKTIVERVQSLGLH